MSDFQSTLAFSALMIFAFMMFPKRALLASKPIVAILKALPMYGLSKIAVAAINKTKK